MAKKDDIEAILTDAGYDVSGAKAGLAALDANKGKAEIADVQIQRWIDDYFHNGRPFFAALAARWLKG